MAGTPIVRIQLSHLISREGEPDPDYISAVTNLTDAIQNDHVCLLKFDAAEAATIKNGLSCASATLAKQRNIGNSKKQGGEAQLDGDIVGGYHALPEKEIYNVMLGERPHDQPLVESFRVLSDASRRVLRALAWGLHVDTSHFEPLLDNAPLRHPIHTTSMLSYFRYMAADHVKTEGGKSGACPKHIDQGLLTIVTSDKPGLEVFSRGAWTLVDADLAPDELALFPGQALTEATAGLISAAEHRITHVSSADADVSGASAGQGRLSAAFKCRPRLDATFDRGPIFAAHTSVGSAYVRDQRLLPVAAYVADITARYESVNDVKVKKEVYDGEYDDGASMPAHPDQKAQVENDEFSASPTKKVKVEKYNLRARPEAAVAKQEKAPRQNLQAKRWKVRRAGYRIE